MEYLDENALREIMMNIENEDDLRNWCSLSSIHLNLCRKYKKEWYTSHTKIVVAISKKRETKIIGNRKYVTVWYEGGNKSYEDEYKDGEIEKCTEWCENGKKSYEGEYKNGKKEEKRFEWYDNGTIQCETKIIGNKKHVTFWYNNGTTYYEWEYKDGKAEGKWFGWYISGNKWYEEEYKDGKQEGKWFGLYENGTNRYKGEYKNGKKCGTWIYWDTNGRESHENYDSCGTRIWF